MLPARNLKSVPTAPASGNLSYNLPGMHERTDSLPQQSKTALEVTEDLPVLEAAAVRGSQRGSGASVARNAVIVGGAFIASRLLGVLREVAIAAEFGTSADYDAYVAAFRIPDLLFLIVMSGAFGSAFIPIFAGFFARDDEAGAWKLASAVLSYTLVILLALSLAVFVLAEPLMRFVIAPGLDPEQIQLATKLTRVLLFSPLLLGLGIAFKGMLEAQERFALAAIAPVLYNVGIIFGALVLTAPFGIYGLAYGVIVGAFLHAGIQFVGLLRTRMRLKWELRRDVPGLRQVTTLMGPRIIGQAAFQVNFIVLTNFASRLAASSVGALNYAFQIFMLPYGVVALSLSTVIFPRLSREFELGHLGDMKNTLNRALGPVIFLSIPAAIGLVTYRTSIVQTLFQIGSFDQESTSLVAGALPYFGVGLLGWALIEVLTRAFYAMQDTRTPVTIAVSAVVLNILLSWLLSQEIGYQGLALSISIASSVEAILLVAILQRRIGFVQPGLLGSATRSLLAGTLFFPYAVWSGRLLAEATDPALGRSIGTYIMFGYALGTAVAVYLGCAYVVGSPELLTLSTRIPIVGRHASRLLAPRYDFDAKA